MASGASSSSDSTAPPASGAGNSFVSLGAFETMGESEGRAATGVAYLQEQLDLQEREYNNDTLGEMRKAWKGVGLAQSNLQVGRHHHQQQDAVESIGFYERARDVGEDALKVISTDRGPRAMKAVSYTKFMLTEISSSLGIAYNDVDRGDEALEMLKKALNDRKETVGKEHPSVAECLNNLGAVYFGRGAHQKSLEYYEQALELLVVASGGEEGAYVALTLYNVGTCRLGLGQIPQAVSNLKKAKIIAERALGFDHRQVDLITQTLEKLESITGAR